MSAIVSSSFRNATVGVLEFVSDDGIALLRCDEVFTEYVVPCRILNTQDAMMLVDQFVCVWDNKVGRLA
jgi:hypothetical protein